MQFIVRVALSQFDYINYMLITITIEMHACMHMLPSDEIIDPAHLHAHNTEEGRNENRCNLWWGSNASHDLCQING